jgi:hypothetical protein
MVFYPTFLSEDNVDYASQIEKKINNSVSQLIDAIRIDTRRQHSGLNL